MRTIIKRMTAACILSAMIFMAGCGVKRENVETRSSAFDLPNAVSAQRMPLDDRPPRLRFDRRVFEMLREKENESSVATENSSEYQENEIEENHLEERP